MPIHRFPVRWSITSPDTTQAPTVIGPNPATTSGLADYDNQHPYPNNGNPPLEWVNRTQALGNETPATGPAVYTETGYSSTQVGTTVQAKYTLDLLMDDAQSGIANTYLYELMDEGDGYGLFDSSNNPKPVATAIHNLTTILADSGTGFVFDYAGEFFSQQSAVHRA